MASKMIGRQRVLDAARRRKNPVPLLLAGMLTLLSQMPMANAAIEFQEEYAKLIKAADTMEPLSGSLFGESVGLYNGSVEFAATDVSLPGNSALPVAFGRRFVVESRGEGVRRFPLSDWDIEIPYLSSVFAQGQGWVVDIGGRWSPRRCSAPANAQQVAPPNYYSGTPATEWSAEEFWIAPSLYVPGQGNQAVLFAHAGVTRPSDGPNYRWSTKNNWFMSCIELPNQDTGSREQQEGFLARSPDGLVYRFDKMVTLPYASLIHTTGVGYSHIAQREEVRLYPTRIEDRFGNSVTYTWRGDRLVSIQGNDGRQLSMTYNANGRIATVSDQSRTWTYQYAAGAADHLEAVILPDASRWEFQLTSLANTSIAYQPAVPGNAPPMEGPYCNKSRLFVAGAANRRIATITHPSGAKGTFEFEATRHGRTYVDDDCQQPNDDQPLFHHNLLPIRFDTMALVGKTISGAGIQTGTHANPDPSLPGYYWSYDYHPGIATVPAGTTSLCASNPGTCPETKNVAVVAPDGTRSLTQFGIRYGVNEGYSMSTGIYAPDSSVALRSQSFSYATGGMPGAAFPLSMGEVPWLGRGDAFSSAQQHPQRSRMTNQDDTAFTWEAVAFDTFAKPTQVVRNSSVSGGALVEQITYHNDPARWTLGQVKTVHHVNADGSLRLKQENTYSTNAQLLTDAIWGKLQKIRSYHANGLLASISDATGISHATTLNDYYRGVPRQVGYADGSAESATVSNIGRLLSVTDEQGFTSNYDYDAAGKLIRVHRPTGDVVAWTPTDYVTERVATSEFGLVGNHWRQTVTTGNSMRVSYLDAMYRPVLIREWDAAAPADVRFTAKRYDADGKVVFLSNPVSSLPGGSFLTASEGTDSTYDALGRPTAVSVDSELGSAPLATTTQYLSGFLRRTTDPLNHATTETFVAWDEPSYDYPTQISAPEGVVTSIQRDLWGKPTRIVRSGSYAGTTTAVARQFAYDDFMRLCKVIEPEGGSQFIDYDLAGNVAWTAPASRLSSVICDRSAAVNSEKTTRGYDARNRLLSTTYPAGTASVNQTYFPDGALKAISSGSSLWTYEYNRRRLLEKETLSIDGNSFVFDWGYDALGSTASLIYPDGSMVDYAPDAFGRPTRVGTYASSIQYHVSGALRRFTYGNAIQHEMTQNRRLLPERSTDKLNGSSVVNYQYGYDADGNVAQISGGVAGDDESRTLGYDGLDRLTSAYAPGLWGNAAFAYDGADNLRRMEVGARVYDYLIDGAQNRVSQLRENGNPLLSVGYDALGNVSTKGSQSFVFDKANRMTSGNSGAGGVTETYTYDGHGRRVTIQKSGQSGKRYAVYNQGGQLLHERDASGAPTNYVYLGGTLLARLQQGTAGPATPVVTVNPASPSSGDVTVGWTNVLAQGNYSLRVTRDSDTPQIQLIAAPTLSKTLIAPEGGTYRFDVGACTPAGVCATPASVFDYGVTPKPVSEISVPSGTQTGSYTINWSASIGATGYRVEETDNNGASYSVVTASTTALSINLPGSIAGSYRYRVTAINNWGEREGAVSSAVAVQGSNTCDGVTTLAAPTLSPIVSTGVSSYTLQWSASDCATHYKLQESTNGGLTWLAPPDYPDPFSGLTAAFSGRADATYLYRVQASRPQLNPPTPSAWSNQQSIIIQGSPQPPAIPTGMRLGSVGIPPDPANPDIVVYGNNQTVDALWNATAGATYYKLTRMAHETACNITDGVEVINAPSNWRLTIPVKRVCQGQAFTPATYSFMVQACNALNLCSDPSTAASVEVHPAGSGAPESVGALQPTYYHTDALGSPVAETNASGAVTRQMRYEPYGAPLDAVYTDAPGYTGHVADATTRLNYMQQRYYDPQLGRFMSIDPVAADANTGSNFNRYWYASNSPYKFTDPDGRDPEVAYGAAVGLMMGNDPEKMRIWAGGEAAATTEGSGAEVGAAIGTAIGEFVRNGDYSKQSVVAVAVKAMVSAVTKGKVKEFKPGARFTPAQKRDILAANRVRNGGELKSDKSGEALVPSEKSRSGVTPSPQEAQVDHKTPRAAGGTNDPANAQVLSRKENRDKSDKVE